MSENVKVTFFIKKNNYFKEKSCNMKTKQFKKIMGRPHLPEQRRQYPGPDLKSEFVRFTSE